MLSSLGRPHLVVRLPGDEGDHHRAPVTGSGTTAVGPLMVAVQETKDGWAWSVVNTTDAPLAVTSVSLTWDAGPAGETPRFFRNGYQSWSRTGVAVLGVDTDPSRAMGAPSLVRGMHHADATVAAEGVLRSEMVTVLDLGVGDDLRLIGFLGGTEHDGTIRASLTDDRHVTLSAEAFFGGAVLAPAEERPLHVVTVVDGPRGSAPELLESWAARVGKAGMARTGAAFQVGWCSWYHYFHDISEDALRANLALAGDWPFEVFQLDDGYQADIGDWLRTNERFPSSLDALADDIEAAGVTPGIWLAPFLVGPDSEVATAHPDWIAPHTSGKPLIGMVNPGWGGQVHTLDTTIPEVLAHIEGVAAHLVDAGFPYLKLDFTYAPSMDGMFADPSRTPAQRVRAGMEAVRRGAGKKAFLLGCGLPLGVGVGIVDGMRIGADVAPWWEVQHDQWNPPGYLEVEPATRNAWVNTLTRAFMHRRLWLNDPDCVMLRTAETRMGPDAARAWALAVGASGGMALVSDDLALLGDGARELLDEVVCLGRIADDAARAGAAPRCDDLMSSAAPRLLSAGTVHLVGDPDDATAVVTRSS
ncbi:MAG TPA: glycoside hydrolase family 36 protein [Acidimicrobiales bacterium]|nr:glycoside hydrolase family 36 protein [Acidimicrobiales bacterium]